MIIILHIILYKFNLITSYLKNYYNYLKINNFFTDCKLLLFINNIRNYNILILFSFNRICIIFKELIIYHHSSNSKQ